GGERVALVAAGPRHRRRPARRRRLVDVARPGAVLLRALPALRPTGRLPHDPAARQLAAHAARRAARAPPRPPPAPRGDGDGFSTRRPREDPGWWRPPPPVASRPWPPSRRRQRPRRSTSPTPTAR